LRDPAELAKLGRLELIAERVLEGLVSGRHRSPYKGSSVEFAEHRSYSRGDECRLIDWRIYGRSDRYYIKQFEQETNLHCWLVVDASGSMGFRLKGVSKLQYARMMAAALAHILLRQQDAVGLVCAVSAIRHCIPPRARPDHMGAIIGALQGATAQGPTALATVLNELAGRARRRGLVIVLSDCFDEPDPLVQALRHLHARGHELLLFQIMAPEEISFPLERWSRFECLEGSAAALELDPATVREAYLAELEAFTSRLQRCCGEIRSDFVRVTTDQPIGEVLARYLAFRAARMKR
jgi:uncharacterized protein (DUF58 family)